MDGSGATTGHKVYLNGSNLATTVIGSGTTTIDASTKLQYGGTDGTAEYFASTCFEIRMYNRVLSANEIKSLSIAPGIAYTPRRRRFYSLAGPTFNAAWARGANQFIQPSLIGVA